MAKSPLTTVMREDKTLVEIYEEPNGDFRARNQGDPKDGSLDRVYGRGNTLFTVKEREGR
jgi:hypothetical protein